MSERFRVRRVISLIGILLRRIYVALVAHSIALSLHYEFALWLHVPKCRCDDDWLRGDARAVRERRARGVRLVSGVQTPIGPMHARRRQLRGRVGAGARQYMRRARAVDGDSSRVHNDAARGRPALACRRPRARVQHPRPQCLSLRLPARSGRLVRHRRLRVQPHLLRSQPCTLSLVLELCLIAT